MAKRGGFPGGMPGTINLGEHAGVCEQLKKACEKGNLIAASCAAPSVFGKLGLLEGKKAICYPGMENQMAGAVMQDAGVVRDGRIITGRAAGAAEEFGFALLAALRGEQTARTIAEQIVYER